MKKLYGLLVRHFSDYLGSSLHSVIISCVNLGKLPDSLCLICSSLIWGEQLVLLSLSHGGYGND